MNHYLLLPRLTVQGANALAGQLAVNAAQVMAVNLFAHNLGRKTGLFPAGVAIVHHHADMLGESFYQFQPQQRRGAAFIDKNDYPSGSQSLAIQPTASFNWQVSLVLRFDAEPDVGKIEDFLASARLAGGQIVDYQLPRQFTDSNTLCKQIKSGFWLIERPDLLQDAEGRVDDPLAALFAVLGRKAQKKAPAGHPPDVPVQPEPSISEVKNGWQGIDDDEQDEGEGALEAAATSNSPTNKNAPPASWLQPALLGYVAITEFESRSGSREGLPHAYAEALYGLVQYVSVREFAAHPLPFWHMAWSQADVFTVHCPLVQE